LWQTLLAIATELAVVLWVQRDWFSVESNFPIEYSVDDTNRGNF